MKWNEIDEIDNENKINEIDIKNAGKSSVKALSVLRNTFSSWDSRFALDFQYTFL